MKDFEIGGKKVSKWWLVGGAAGGVIVFIIIRRSKSGSSSAASTPDPSATDPVTGLPYSMDSDVDPATGLTYLAEAEQYGSVSAAEAAVSGASDVLAGGTGSTSALDAGTPTISGSVTGTGGYASNAQWSQAVTTGLVSLGYSAQDVASALGLYFQGAPLGTASDGTSYLSIVQAAVAEFGAPPDGTYAIIAPPSSGGAVGTGTGGGTGTSGTGGTGSGGTAAPGPAAPVHYPAPGGLHATDVTASGCVLSWDEVAGSPPGFHAQVLTATGTTLLWQNASVSGTSVTVTGLPKGTACRARVSVNVDGAWTGYVYFTTSK